MNIELIHEIELLNPWLVDSSSLIINENIKYIPRLQTERLLSHHWDNKWLILTGPRQTGKTTLGKHICQSLLTQHRFEQLLYLSCDYIHIREWLKSPIFIDDAIKQFNLKRFILFIDEVQRIENPGLLLKSIVDLQRSIKMIASGSSQLEIKSKVQEHLTGRQFESLVLPFSYEETPTIDLETRTLWGAYPGIVQTDEKALALQQIFKEYITKDIIEILRVGEPDVMQKLISLIAHSSGQLVQYQQLANDCRVAHKTVQRYLSVLERTYVIQKIVPFVGNKRSEITSNPIYYFVDNGFRNQALSNFSSLSSRNDNGFLIENLIFQELYKFKQQYFKDFDIHFWRTTSGAEVDFVLTQGVDQILPIEVKFRNFKRPTITRAMRSFIEAYQPKHAIFVTKNYIANIKIEDCIVHFVSTKRLGDFISLLKKLFA